MIGPVQAGPAWAKTEPLDFVRKGMQHRGPERPPRAALAANRPELRRLWDRFDQRGKRPIIRFEKNVAILANAAGSSSCPYRLHALRLDGERERVVVRVYQEEFEENQVCTADVQARTYTVAVPRAGLRPFRPRDLKVHIRRIDDPNS